MRAVLPNEKINGRPTFHYRLPDARLSDPGWSIAPDWNRWVASSASPPTASGSTPRRGFPAFEGEDKSWANVAEQFLRS